MGSGGTFVCEAVQTACDQCLRPPWDRFSTSRTGWASSCPSPGSTGKESGGGVRDGAQGRAWGCQRPGSWQG